MLPPQPIHRRDHQKAHATWRAAAVVACVALATRAAGDPSPSPRAPAAAGAPDAAAARADQHRALMDRMRACVANGVRRTLADGDRNRDQIVAALGACRDPLVASGYMTPARAEGVYREAVDEALQHVVDDEPDQLF